MATSSLRTTSRPAPRLLLTLLVLVLLAPSSPLSAQEETAEPVEDDSKIFSASIRLVGEHDSNVTLGSDIECAEGDVECVPEPAEDDIVWRAQPELSLEIPWEESLFSLGASGDFREGTDTELSEYNAAVNALADVVFTGGFGFKLWDDWAKTSFDQALYATPEDLGLAAGITESESNSYGGGLSFNPKERLDIEGTYEQRDEDLTIDVPVVPGAPPAGFEENREIETIRGRIAIPVSERWLTYGAYRSIDQVSDQRLDRTYDDERYLVGLQFEGPNRVRLWLEGGQQTIDFKDTIGVVDFEDVTVGAVGVEISFTEATFLRGLVGRDGYEEEIFELVLDHTVEERQSFQLIAQKSTQPAFGTTIGRFFQATLGSVAWRRHLGTKFIFGLEASWFRLESSGATGTQTDDTSLGRVEFLYQPRPWLRFGPHVQYSERESNLPENRFEDLRAGLALTLSY